MHKEDLKFVIVGHIDHGKSTLIGRLLYDTDSLPEEKIEEIKKTCQQFDKKLEFAYITDHLQEEREQGVTIDTAQTFFKTSKRNYVIIDAPGHKEFIKNMITGASQAEAAILIVDAKEGVQEQTKRHTYVLSMLGLDQVIVVVNKMDLVGYKKERFDKIKKEIFSFMDSINIKPSFIIPISALEGDNVAKRSGNIKWFSGPTVLKALDTFVNKISVQNKPLRFPIQDVYDFKDKKILVGKIESGRLKIGDEIIFLPSKNTSTICSIEKFKEAKKEAAAGESIGITISDSLNVGRGEIVCKVNDVPKTVCQFKANVFWMAKEKWHKDDRILLRCTTQEVSCIAYEISRRIDSSTLEILEKNANELGENEVGEVIIKCQKPIVIESFNEIQELGRFVLIKGYDVVAGGIVI